MDDIDKLILEAASFYTPMKKDILIMEFQESDIINLKDFDLNTLEKKLQNLCRKGHLKKAGKGKDTTYIRTLPSSLKWYQKFIAKLF